MVQPLKSMVLLLGVVLICNLLLSASALKGNKHSESTIASSSSHKTVQAEEDLSDLVDLADDEIEEGEESADSLDDYDYIETTTAGPKVSVHHHHVHVHRKESSHGKGHHGVSSSTAKPTSSTTSHPAGGQLIKLIGSSISNVTIDSTRALGSAGPVTVELRPGAQKPGTVHQIVVSQGSNSTLSSKIATTTKGPQTREP